MPPCCHVTLEQNLCRKLSIFCGVCEVKGAARFKRFDLNTNTSQLVHLYSCCTPPRHSCATLHAVASSWGDNHLEHQARGKTSRVFFACKQNYDSFAPGVATYFRGINAQPRARSETLDSDLCSSRGGGGWGVSQLREGNKKGQERGRW